MYINVSKFLAENFDVTETNSGFRIACPIHHGDNQKSMKVDISGSWKCYNCKRSGSTLWDLLIAWQHLETTAKYEPYGGLELLCTQESAVMTAISMLYPYTELGTDSDVEPIDHTVNDAMVFAQEREEIYKRELAGMMQIIQGANVPSGLHQSWYGPINKAMAYMFGRGFSAKILELEQVYTWDKSVRTAYPLMFTLFYQDKILGYQLRAISDHIEPKYLTMPGLVKQQWLYGSVPDGKHVILLCEGHTDRIKARQYQYPWVFTTLGSVLSSEQADLLEQHASHVIIAYHNDDAGNRGAWGVETQMAFRQIRTTRLQVPTKDLCVAGEYLFYQAIERAYQDLGLLGGTYDRARQGLYQAV